MDRNFDEVVADFMRDRVTPLTHRAGRHPALLDALSAVVLAVASFVGITAQGRLHNPDVVVFCFAIPAPLLLRHRERRVAFALVAAIALVQWLVSTPQLSDGAVLVAFFWIMLDGELTEMASASTVVALGAIMAAFRWSPNDPVKVWVGISGLGVATGGLGVTIRQRRALVASLEERAARLEFERDQEGRLGAAAERARIAREMHDIVSHNLTVMTSLADGAAYALRDTPDTALSAMQRVSETGRQALAEMRRLLGVLREEDGDDPYAPQPGLDRLDELLARVEAAGIPVSVTISGDPHALPGGVQLTLFRVTQEALTNTLKHAGSPASAALELDCASEGLTLTVTDTGHGGPRPDMTVSAAAPVSAAPTGGRGLPGMRERAAAYGGRLDAGPLPDGGWRVSLRLPVSVATPEEAPLS